MPLPWQIVTTAGPNRDSEYKISTITQSTSEDRIYKSEMSLLRNLTQMIKAASCQRLNIYKSETSRLRNATHMIKVGSCHVLMNQTWEIITAEGLDGVAEYNFFNNHPFNLRR